MAFTICHPQNTQTGRPAPIASPVYAQAKVSIASTGFGVRSRISTESHRNLSSALFGHLRTRAISIERHGARKTGWRIRDNQIEETIGDFMVESLPRSICRPDAVTMEWAH